MSNYTFNPEYPTNDWNSFFKTNESTLDTLWNEIEQKDQKLLGMFKIYPSSEKVYRAFELCSLKDTRVVILGQDCYHGQGQANGLCFSVDSNIAAPPSLKNIITEMSNDGYIRSNSDFSGLASQGVLFLNSALTVLEGQPESHIKLWVKFTDSIIKSISDEKEHVVFILWGNYAIDKQKLIDHKKHYIITGKHPSPLSANRGGFFGGNYFSKTNTYLENTEQTPIDWTL